MGGTFDLRGTSAAMPQNQRPLGLDEHSNLSGIGLDCVKSGRGPRAPNPKPGRSGFALTLRGKWVS